MSDALTSLDRRLRSDVDLAATGPWSSAAGSVLPSYLSVFGIFSQRFLRETGASSRRRRLRLGGQFPLGSAFVAIV
jgi:hypothetical protein